jgi:hypothetical protein
VGSRRGLFRIDELGASDRCRTGLFESYWRLRAWLCDLIGYLASEWNPTRKHSGCLQGQYSRVGERCWRRCMYRMFSSKPVLQKIYHFLHLLKHGMHSYAITSWTKQAVYTNFQHTMNSQDGQLQFDPKRNNLRSYTHGQLRLQQTILAIV